LNQPRNHRSVWQFAGLFLFVSLFSYQARELLACWLFFGMAFFFLAGAIAVGMLGAYAGKRTISWVGKTAGVNPGVTPSPADLQLKNGFRRSAREVRSRGSG
jgi:hypothetical protein